MRIKDIATFNPKGIKPNDYINYIDTSSVEDGKLICVQKLYSEPTHAAGTAVGSTDQSPHI